MSTYTYNITSARGDENLILGRGGQVTKITLITVNKPSGAFSFSLLLTKIISTGNITTPLYAQDLADGDSLIDTNGYLVDASTILSISATAGVDIVVIGETSPETAVNPIP